MCKSFVQEAPSFYELGAQSKQSKLGTHSQRSPRCPIFRNPEARLLPFIFNSHNPSPVRQGAWSSLPDVSHDWQPSPWLPRQLRSSLLAAGRGRALRHGAANGGRLGRPGRWRHVPLSALSEMLEVMDSGRLGCLMCEQ